MAPPTDHDQQLTALTEKIARFDNARRLRALSAQLEALSLQAANRAEGWVEK
ncbi:MAG: hypothetical protein LC790_14470 [Actinobacteria bacterium]|nr:hypothetical protein [Actinomycetota bacterium]